MRVRLYATSNTRALRRARQTVAQSLDNGLAGLGKVLVPAVQGRMREFEGREKKSVRYVVEGRGRANSWARLLVVFSTVVQAFVDELGLKPGTFPPWDVGTKLFRYVRRRGLTLSRPREEHHNFGVNRAKRKISHVRSRAPRGHWSRTLRGTRRGRQYAQRSGEQLKRPLARRSRAQRAALRTNARRRARQNETRRMAFLVARAIFERGIKAGRPFARTLEANRARALQAVQNAVTRAVNKINRGGF